MDNALGEPQTIVVLGGASELGQAIAAELAGPAMTAITLGARDPEPALAQFATTYAAVDAEKVHSVPFDAVDSTSAQRALATAAEQHGDIDVVVLAFGVLGASDVETDPAAAAHLARVNYEGIVSAGLAAGERLRAQGHGTIVVLSSVAGVRVRRSNFVYGSSKAAVDAFGLGLHDSLTDAGVNVVVVRPGFVHTKMTAGLEPAPFSVQPADVATAVADGVRTGARIVWAPPILKVVMNLLRFAPPFVWRKLDR